MKRASLAISLALAALPAQAGELVAALGGSDISLDAVRAAGVGEISYRFGDMADGIAPEASLVAHDKGFGFAGAGVALRRELSGPWFVEGGAQFGALIDTKDRGFSGDPALRASLGIGREIRRDVSASVGVSRIAGDGIRLDSLTFRLHIGM